MGKLNITILLLFSINFLVGQSIDQNQKFDNSIFLQSDILQEKREIQVFLPEGYHDSSKVYPVLYVIDAQRYFLNGIVFQQNLTWQEIAPEFIVIGVNTNPVQRRKLFYRESSKFIQFLEKELIPEIDTKYRTLDERIFFGWEMAAGLGVQILANTPSLFKGFLLSSPTHVSKDRLRMVSELIKNNPEQRLTIYSVLGTVENWATESMASLDSIFKKHPNKNILWDYTLSENENQYTTPLTTINEGLKLIFDDYGPIRFYSIKEFENFGGIEKLKQHYHKRALRYQTSKDIHADTKHYLLLQAHKENNFKLFETLVNEIDGKAFIKSYYRQPRWFNRYYGFYFENDKPEDALEILNLGLDKFPNASLLHFVKANHYKNLGKIKEARPWYQKAITLAKTNNEPELEKYISEWEKHN